MGSMCVTHGISAMPMTSIISPRYLDNLISQASRESLLGLAARIEFAGVLCRLELRPKQIYQLIGGNRLSLTRIYDIWAEVNGRRPPPGQDISHVIFHITPANARIQASVFFGLFLAHNGKTNSDVDDNLKAFILAYRDFQFFLSQFEEKPVIDARVMILLLNDIRFEYSAISWVKCRKCKMYSLRVPQIGSNCLLCGANP